MVQESTPTKVAAEARHRWIGRTVLTAIGVSIALMVSVGIEGPSPVVVTFPVAPPLPPWYFHTHPSVTLVGIAVWLAVLVGAGGLGLGLVAVRQGWRPRPRRLIVGSVLAVMVLLVMPPAGSADMLLYVASGRIVVVGHSPYVMTPGQLKSSGDPIGAIVGFDWSTDPTRYGPAATALEAATSELAGTSVARTIFWLKLWNGLAFLTLVLVLDRLVRLNAAQRVRAHLIWSLNPLILWQVMAGGHNDIFGAVLGTSALFALRRADPLRAVLAGLMLGLAAAVKAPFALFGGGLAWAVHKSPRALGALLLGAAAVLVPSYLLAGRDAISASIGVSTMAPVPYTPWFIPARLFGLPYAWIDALGLLSFPVLAVILLWRMPVGSRSFAAVRVSLALSLALLIASPQQEPWYYVMIFPLLAVVPASRLDWVAIVDVAAGSLGQLPRLFRTAILSPAWVRLIVKIGYAGFVPLMLTAAGALLLWLCFTNDWRLWEGDCEIPGPLLPRVSPGLHSGSRSGTRRTIT